MMSEPCLVEATKQPKHLELNDALYDSDSVLLRLKELINKITGDDIPDTNAGEVPRNLPSLSVVLLDSPDRIRANSDEAHKLIDEIHQLLF